MVTKGLGTMKKLNKKGFTLIEVVLVLAIGGLIFLLAFLAFQNASTNRRDTQRRNDANRLVSELQNYASDRNGAIPTTAEFPGFVSTYMGSPFQGPSGKNYVIGTTASKPSATADSTFTYTPGTGSNKGCDTATTAPNMGTKDFKIEMGLEKGTVCRDSL